MPTGVAAQKRNMTRKELTPALPAPPAIRLESCPAHLDKEAQAEWGRMVERLRVWCPATILDEPALAIYCAAWSRHVRCEQKAAKSKDGEATVKWSDAADKAAKTALRALTDFGMTPANRMRMRMTAMPGQAVGGGDALTAFAQAKEQA